MTLFFQKNHRLLFYSTWLILTLAQSASTELIADEAYYWVYSRFPDWVPFVGGNEFEFFSPIFNIADASISVGVITLLLFQKRLVRRYHEPTNQQTVTTSSELSDKAQVM